MTSRRPRSLRAALLSMARDHIAFVTTSNALFVYVPEAVGERWLRRYAHRHRLSVHRSRRGDVFLVERIPATDTESQEQ